MPAPELNPLAREIEKTVVSDQLRAPEKALFSDH
jgi:hypothetical protein